IAEVEMMLPKTKYERGIVNISTIVIATIKNPIIWSYLLLEGGRVIMPTRYLFKQVLIARHPA
ncbi:MAG: hypothetical protein ABSE82_14645, partial [Nitrososphaerales archaeon]